ncbi:MAG TPA: hypothetical protein VKU00_01820 [Chthonomonadaceae bacterium]|nr:hypothetical protein [Chthonomonadaceae bacterium]
MEDEGFVFEIEGAVTVWYGRFTTIWGRLTKGTIVLLDVISLPMKDGSQKNTYVKRLSDEQIHQEAERVGVTSGCEKPIAIQVMGTTPADSILVPGTAIKGDRERVPR